MTPFQLSHMDSLAVLTFRSSQQCGTQCTPLSTPPPLLLAHCTSEDSDDGVDKDIFDCSAEKEEEAALSRSDEEEDKEEATVDDPAAKMKSKSHAGGQGGSTEHKENSNGIH